MTTLAPSTRNLADLALHPLRRVLSVPQTVAAWGQRRRTRADLRALDPHMLRDIGLNWAEAEREAQKPFWRA
jgi:uncharacterized protein YjiS (DUF1127 family)